MGELANIIAQVTKGAGAIVAGNAKDDAANFEAQQLRMSGRRVMAAATSQAQIEEHKGKLLASRATAVAAASGGGASDPTVVKIISDIKGEATLRANEALYAGESQKQLLQTQANAKKLEGKQARQASIITATGEFAKAGVDAGSLYDKYGGKNDLIIEDVLS